VGTANVLCTLGPDDAREALRVVVSEHPDLVGLQEWTVSRHGLLRELGPVMRAWPGVPSVHRVALTDDRGYAWVAPVLGGCPVGFRTDRFELVGARVRLLGGVGRCERTARAVPVLPARFAVVVTLHDRDADRTVGIVNYHLTPGVQARGRYRDDRPLLVARHQAEVRRLGGLVAGLGAAGHAVYALGDSNFDGLRLPGLTSAWDGREDSPGTFGERRKIDDVHGPGPALSVTLLPSPSDHRAVLVRRADR
jgi:hypothetical protein